MQILSDISKKNVCVSNSVTKLWKIFVPFLEVIPDLSFHYDADPDRKNDAALDRKNDADPDRKNDANPDRKNDADPDDPDHVNDADPDHTYIQMMWIHAHLDPHCCRASFFPILLQVRAISMSDGKNLAAFFNISFPIWLRQSHVLNAPRYSIQC